MLIPQSRSDFVNQVPAMIDQGLKIIKSRM